MPSLLHSVQVQDQAVSADGILTFDLGVNPLSVILLVIRPLNDTGTLADFASYLCLCESMNNITVFHRGASVMNMNGGDAAALAYMRHGIQYPDANHDDVTNDRRAVVLPLLFGRFAYDPVSCFPSTKRGELEIQLDIDVAGTGYDGFRLSIETIELLGISPKSWERKVTHTQTFAATGINDVELPLGNLHRGLLLFGTTGSGGAAPAPSWGRISVELNNQMVGYKATDFEVAHGLHSLMGRQPPTFDNHTHRITVDGMAQTELETLGGPLEVGSGWNTRAFLDFDPTRDDFYSIDTSKAARFVVRADAETADLVRVVSIEKVMV